MAVAVNDMRVLERLTVAELEARAEVFSAARVVVVDANLSAEAIEWVASHVAAPILLDPVSAAKAPRVAGVLGRLAVLKCNVMEAAVLAGVPEPQDADGIERVASELRARGVGDGVHHRRQAGRSLRLGRRIGLASRRRTSMVENATGAGDAFSAGVAWGMLQGWRVGRCAAAGSALAAMALASERTVSELVSAQTASRCNGGDAVVTRNPPSVGY